MRANSKAATTEVPGATMVEARGVEKTYATGETTVRALRGVDLSITRGEMVAIMGPSGCGKTTLLNCLSGLDGFDAGEVLIGGEPISGMSDRKRTRFRAERMGFVFQTYNLIPVLSGAENVELPLLVAGARPKEARRRALDALEMVGVPEQANKRPNEMSGGQQQRVTVARSLVNDPAIVWADEPTGALDSETSEEIVDLLVGLNRDRGQTFVLVTHDASVAGRAHRLIRMRDGSIEGEERNGAGGRDG
ncbi:ABC transporter ATP-binding protein [Rubrobacter xylanophilus]|uniref:ABC transporter ATP-binding protein n=1 Tax=Rubrobacter xylanophilus TaxID=49319 RepID=UPI001F351043|nr:ABC transporter ATP-binding protein [Rubrobacter xylanophilus]